MGIRPLSKELQEVAVKELNEVPSRVQADLDHIREWISQQPHLKARTDDQWLLAFLRSSKFSLQRTKEKLDNFYTARNITPEFHSNRDPFSPEIQKMLCSGTIVFLPKTAHPAAPRIMFFRICKMENISLITACKVFIMIMDILIWEDDNFVIAGKNLVGDYKNTPYSYLAELTLDLCKKMIIYIQDVYPIRMKEINYFNAPSAFVAIFNLVKIFLPEKLKNRIIFHSPNDLKKSFVTKTLPATILPKEYGGEEVSWDELAAITKAKVESYRDWFLEDAQYGTDESKRLRKSKMQDSLFGVEGSFKKLEVD